jgi:CTP:molybdopterin cytidylyltransferase MocA
MAAGAGRRLGHRPKCLLQRDGQPLLVRQLGLLAAAGVDCAAVVLGHHAEAIEPVLSAAAPQFQSLAVRWVRNPAPDAGPGSSLRCGLAALPPALDAVLVLLADQPLLLADDLAHLLAAWRGRAAGIDLVVPTHGGQPGHPVALGAAVRQAVAAGQGGEGVREWRLAHPSQTWLLPVHHPRCTTDIDQPADLARLAGEHGVALEWPAAPG